MSNVSVHLLDQVEASVPVGGGATPKTIHGLVGCWSLATVRNAICELVRMGRISFTGEDCKRLYSRPYPKPKDGAQ